MALNPKELDRLLVFTAAELARRRLARGVKLNHPEAVALLTDEIFEAARDGMSVEEVVERAATILTVESVMDGVAEMVPSLSVDALFPDGTRLVTVNNPIGPAR